MVGSGHEARVGVDDNRLRGRRKPSLNIATRQSVGAHRNPDVLDQVWLGVHHDDHTARTNRVPNRKSKARCPKAGKGDLTAKLAEITKQRKRSARFFWQYLG
jgi:hypothetical protein